MYRTGIWAAAVALVAALAACGGGGDDAPDQVGGPVGGDDPVAITDVYVLPELEQDDAVFYDTDLGQDINGNEVRDDVEHIVIVGVAETLQEAHFLMRASQSYYRIQRLGYDVIENGLEFNVERSDLLAGIISPTLIANCTVSIFPEDNSAVLKLVRFAVANTTTRARALAMGEQYIVQNEPFTNSNFDSTDPAVCLHAFGRSFVGGV